MAAKRQKVHHTNEYSAYIQGNTVRKAAPARHYEEAVPKKIHRKVSTRVKRNRAKALYMDAPYVIALTLAAVCTLLLCINYLQLQASITTKVKSIARMEQEIKNMKAENDALETSIKTSVDLDHVYKVATEELGMVYADKNQVRLYKKTESEYVRQNESIPEH